MIRCMISIAVLTVFVLSIRTKNLPAQEFLAPDPDFVMIESKIHGESVYEDIMSHFSDSFGDIEGRPTNVHETAHMIHSRERNKHFKKIGRCNVFYCLKGRTVVLREPSLKMEDIKIPVAARSNRYDMYFRKQLRHWNDTPTYPLDEWTAYIIGAECAVEDHKLGVATVKSDAVSGCLEFSIYSIATAMSVKEKDLDYWVQEYNFRRLLRFNLSRAEKAFFSGRNVFKSHAQEELLHEFRHGEGCKDLRDFMIEEFGEFFLVDQ